MPEFTTILTRAEVAVIDEIGDVSTEYATFRVPDRRRDQFNFVMWDYPRGIPGYWGLRSLRDNGVTAILNGNPNPPAEIAAVDLAYVPYTTRILEEYDEDMVMQPACWNEDEAINKHVQSIADEYVGARQHGVYVYSLGDENDTHGACAHPACIEAYRTWLQSQYETIEALNGSWGSDYDDFDQIELYKEGDINAQAALNDGHPARWYDRQAFKRYNYAHYCSRYAEAYAEMDPKAITGFEGAGGLGDDYHEIISQVGFWGPYPSIGDDIIRSLAPRSLITSNWMGYHREVLPMVQKMWRMISNGYHGVWWWRWDNIGRFHGFLAPDFHPWDDTSQPVIDEMRDIRDGVGTFMLHADMPHDGVGLLYSMPSAYAGESAPRRRGQQTRAHTGFLEATQDIGLQAHYLCDDTVKEGDLNDGDERVLLLPMCRAIPDVVAEEVRTFVENGGLLIADVRPGIRDGHCKPREAGVLDDVFGIAQDPSGLGGMERTDIETRINVDSTRIELDMVADVDFDLQLDGAEALAQMHDTPLVTINQYGDGHAILLNFNLESYGELREAGDEMPVRKLLRALYAKHDITPPFDQKQPGGPLRATETVRWESGDVTLIDLFKTAGEDTTAITELPEPMHVYDLRRDKYLGEVSRIEGKLRKGYANLYALLPRRLGNILFELREDSAERGDVVDGYARFQGELAGHVPMKLRVFRPDGTEREWPRMQMLTDGRAAEFELPIPYNAETGTWTIQATDLFTNQVVETTVEVKAGK
ncbi:MAG: beta-galactosidase [Armatimonadota bacterium]